MFIQVCFFQLSYLSYVTVGCKVPNISHFGWMLATLTGN